VLSQDLQTGILTGELRRNICATVDFARKKRIKEKRRKDRELGLVDNTQTVDEEPQSESENNQNLTLKRAPMIPSSTLEIAKLRPTTVEPNICFHCFLETIKQSFERSSPAPDESRYNLSLSFSLDEPCKIIDIIKEALQTESDFLLFLETSELLNTTTHWRRPSITLLAAIKIFKDFEGAEVTLEKSFKLLKSLSQMLNRSTTSIIAQILFRTEGPEGVPILMDCIAAFVYRQSATENLTKIISSRLSWMRRCIRHEKDELPEISWTTDNLIELSEYIGMGSPFDLLTIIT
jgi:hypothetical protein